MDALTTRMAKLREEDLVRIAHGTDEDGFETAAIAAAQAEIRNRRLSDDQIIRFVMKQRK